jgi:hypothetical protein
MPQKKFTVNFAGRSSNLNFSSIYTGSNEWRAQESPKAALHTRLPNRKPRQLREPGRSESPGCDAPIYLGGIYAKEEVINEVRLRQTIQPNKWRISEFEKNGLHYAENIDR